MFSWFQTKHEKLIKAIEAENAVEAQRLISEMNITELSKIDDYGNTALTWAAGQGLSSVCEALIPKMSEQTINHVNNDGWTALTWAAYKGLEKVCEALIPIMTQQAIDSVVKDGIFRGCTALILAAYKGLGKVCELLIPKMSEQTINTVVKDGILKGHTALSIAKEKGFKNICDLLETNQKQILSENNELAETVNKFFHNPTSVSLCYQIITDDFAKLVADKLKVIKTITAIDFMGSTVSDQGIKIITEALKTTTQIKKLDFSGGDLGNQKISVLAEVLQLKTLTHLCLNANYIGTVGINAIIEALKENTTITHIDLEQNNIDQQSQIIIEKYLQRNKNIEKTDDKLQKLTDELNDKISNNATINVNDKTKIAEQLKNIACKAKLLVNKVDIEQVTNNLQDLLSKNKITKGNILDLEDDINAIIDSQNINDNISISGADGDSSFI
ncbi:MAG TPA: ankyrin repeat domain-containing protein [Rickettsia endosymbiont of Bembidion nr. Transversale]|nr:ankyrin repeat domain-containing protein [Rickettsia endosymbiont of Bembidion nr. Transversale]